MPYRVNSYLSQVGYTMLEMSIVLTIMALTIMFTIQTNIEDARNDKIKAAAQSYQRLNNIMGSYLTNYYEKLITLAPECSVPTWTSDYPSSSNAAPSVRTGCSLSLSLNGRNPVTVANGLQPTLTELSALGLMQGGGVSTGLPLPTVTSLKGSLRDVSNGNWYMGSKSSALPVQFMMIVEFICVNGSGRFTKTGDCKDSSSGKDAAFDLRSLVFNSQPFDLDNSGGTRLLYRMLQIAGADAYLSTRKTGTSTDAGVGNINNGELWAQKGASEQMIHNPMRHVPSDMGVPHIFAMRNGYGSAGWDRYVRRDGSTPMTANWDFGNKDISNIDSAQINSDMTIGNSNTNTGKLTVNGSQIIGSSTAKQNDQNVLTVNGAATVNGTLSATKGVFGQITSPITASLNALSAYIKDLTANTANFSGDVNFNGNISTASTSKSNFQGEASFYKFRISSENTVGSECNPGSETVTKLKESKTAPYSKGARLLVCDAATNKWINPQQELQTQVDNISTTVINGVSATSKDIFYDGKNRYGNVMNTGYECKGWSRPVVSSINVENPKNVGQAMYHTWCDETSQKWFVTSYSPSGWVESVWLTFKSDGGNNSFINPNYGIKGETINVRYYIEPRGGYVVGDVIDYMALRFSDRGYSDQWDVTAYLIWYIGSVEKSLSLKAEWSQPSGSSIRFPTSHWESVLGFSANATPIALELNNAMLHLTWKAKVPYPRLPVPYQDTMPAWGDNGWSRCSKGIQENGGSFWGRGSYAGGLLLSDRDWAWCKSHSQSSGFYITWK